MLLLQSLAEGTWSTEGRGEAGTVPEEEEACPGSGGMDEVSNESAEARAGIGKPRRTSEQDSGRNKLAQQ